MYLMAKPCSSLSHVVDYFWELDTLASNREVTEYIFAYPYGNLVFNLEEYYEKEDQKEGVIRIASDRFLGPRQLPVNYLHWRKNKLFGIKLKSGALALLTRIHSKELINETPEIKYVNPALYDNVISQVIKDYTTFSKAIQAAEKAIYKNLILSAANDVRLVQYAMAIMQKSDCYTFRIKDMITFTECSIKTLERLFLKIVGVLPKAYYNQVRCEKAIKGMLMQKDNWSFYHYGFTDQAHFIRQVKKYSNLTPLQLKKKLVKTSCPAIMLGNIN